MKSKPSKQRGRRAGQAAKAHDSKMTLGEHHALAMAGNYAPCAAETVRRLARLAKVRRAIETASRAKLEFWATLETDKGGLPLPSGSNFTREEIEALRCGSAGMHWLVQCDRSENWIHALRHILDAIERRDAAFFRDVARRLSNDGQLDKAAERIHLEIALWKQERGNAGPVTLSEVRAELARRLPGVALPDVRTLGRICDSIGLARRSDRGRPRKA